MTMMTLCISLNLSMFGNSSNASEISYWVGGRDVIHDAAATACWTLSYSSVAVPQLYRRHYQTGFIAEPFNNAVLHWNTCRIFSGFTLRYLPTS